MQAISTRLSILIEVNISEQYFLIDFLVDFTRYITGRIRVADITIHDRDPTPYRKTL